MILVDENIIASQIQLLRSWKVRVRTVHDAFGREGLSDSALLAIMRRSGKVTFFTRDWDFYRPKLRHPRLCLVWLDVQQGETATFIRRSLRHPAFRNARSRMGCVIRVSHVAMFVWRRNVEEVEVFKWP